MSDYYLIEWIKGFPTRTAHTTTLKAMLKLNKSIKADDEGVYAGIFPNGNYWRMIKEY